MSRALWTSWSNGGAGSVAHADPDPKAPAGYSLLLRDPGNQRDPVGLRLVDGHPLSALTTRFLAWCCTHLADAGKTALLLIWDNASWHRNKAVRAWISAHNRQVKGEGAGVRLVVCPLPMQSPWLNPIEPRWVHGRRAIVEPDGLLSARELADRVCAHFHCPHHPHLTISEHAA